MGSADFRLVRPVSVLGDVPFSRPSPKSAWDRNGALVQVPANTVAWTYDPADLSKAPYALIELAATNLFIKSNQLNDAAWGKSGVTVPGAPMDTGIDGLNSAFYMAETATNAPHEIRTPTLNIKAGDIQTETIFAKAGTRTRLRMGFSSVFGPAEQYAVFDLVTGEVALNNAPTTLTATIKPAGFGFWRCRITSIATKAATGTNYIGLDLAGAAIYQGDGVSGLYLTRGQHEATAEPSSVIDTDAAPVTRAADVIAPGVGLVGSNVPIVEKPYSAGATFAQGEVVYDPTTYLTYQSLMAGNTGKALTDAAAWGPLKRAVNRWLMFDKAVNSQTSADNEVTVVIQPGELVNVLGLLNVDGSSVTVTQTDSGYSQTKSLVSHDPLSWYDYFYTEPIREGDVIFDGIPPYAGSALCISVINPGAKAAIGCCILGQARTIGQTAWDFTGGILSYSSSSTDAFGNVTMVKRDNSKVLNFEVYIPKGFESAAYRLLSKEYTDVEIMIIGAEDYSMTYAYGFLGQWSVPVSAGGEKTAHIEFKGLV